MAGTARVGRAQTGPLVGLTISKSAIASPTTRRKLRSVITMAAIKDLWRAPGRQMRSASDIEVLQFRFRRAGVNRAFKAMREGEIPGAPLECRYGVPPALHQSARLFSVRRNGGGHRLQSRWPGRKPMDGPRRLPKTAALYVKAGAFRFDAVTTAAPLRQLGRTGWRDISPDRIGLDGTTLALRSGLLDLQVGEGLRLDLKPVSEAVALGLPSSVVRSANALEHRARCMKAARLPAGSSGRRQS
jgi:hypothetical protein